jgi:hypothetical protein
VKPDTRFPSCQNATSILRDVVFLRAAIPTTRYNLKQGIGSCVTPPPHTILVLCSILGIEVDSAAYSHGSLLAVKSKHNQCHCQRIESKPLTWRKHNFKECYQKGISYESDPTAHQCELESKLTEEPASPKILFESCFYANHIRAVLLTKFSNTLFQRKWCLLYVDHDVDTSSYPFERTTLMLAPFTTVVLLILMP